MTGCRWIDLALSLPLVAVCGLPINVAASSCLTYRKHDHLSIVLRDSNHAQAMQEWTAESSWYSSIELVRTGRLDADVKGRRNGRWAAELFG